MYEGAYVDVVFEKFEAKNGVGTFDSYLLGDEHVEWGDREMKVVGVEFVRFFCDGFIVRGTL